MNCTIATNKARCRNCDQTIESHDPVRYETCTCGSIAISGGKKRLTRSQHSWADLEELSEYLLTWRDVLDCKQIYHSLGAAADNAKITGYMFFAFNGEIHRNHNDGRTTGTGKTPEEMPFTIKVLEQ
jgi:hypothetical protein